MTTGTLETVLSAKSRLLSLTASSLLSNEITGLLKDSKTIIFKQGEVANFIIELSILYFQLYFHLFLYYYLREVSLYISLNIKHSALNHERYGNLF